jgi:hypothetical protein
MNTVAVGSSRTSRRHVAQLGRRVVSVGLWVFRGYLPPIRPPEVCETVVHVLPELRHLLQVKGSRAVGSPLYLVAPSASLNLPSFVSCFRIFGSI